MTPHKHAEIIKAWADGAEIEWSPDGDDKWALAKHPSWCDGYQYRVKPTPKPTPKPDVVDFMCVTHGQYMRRISGFNAGPNLKLTYDGETRKLKTAEVIE